MNFTIGQLRLLESFYQGMQESLTISHNYFFVNFDGLSRLYIFLTQTIPLKLLKLFEYKKYLKNKTVFLCKFYLIINNFNLLIKLIYCYFWQHRMYF